MSSTQAARPETTSLPVPSAALVLQEEYARAWMRLSPPRKRRAFLREVCAGMRRLEENIDVVRFRPRSEQAAIRQARLEAIALWKQLLGVLIHEIDR